MDSLDLTPSSVAECAAFEALGLFLLSSQKEDWFTSGIKIGRSPRQPDLQDLYKTHTSLYRLGEMKCPEPSKHVQAVRPFRTNRRRLLAHRRR